MLFLSTQAQHISEWHYFNGDGGGAHLDKMKRYGDNTALWFNAACDTISMDSAPFLFHSSIPPSFYTFTNSKQAYFVLLDSMLAPLIKLQFSAGKGILSHSMEITESGDYLLTYWISDDTVYLNNSIFIEDTTLKKSALCITKVRPDGSIAFNRYFKGSASAAHIDFLSGGKIVLAGQVNYQDIIFDSDTLHCLGCHVEDTDIFVAVLDSTGYTLNAKRFGGPGYDYCRDVMTSLQGDIYLSGSFETNFDCDSLHLDNYSSWIIIDAFLLKMNADLEASWIKHAGSLSTEYGRSITQDSNGNIYWACEFDGEKVIFDGDTLTGGNVNSFLCKMNESGEVLWTKVFTSSDGFILRMPEIATSTNKVLWVALGFNESLISEDFLLTGLGNDDFVLIQLDEEGNVLQSHLVGSTGAEFCNSFQVLNDHQLFVSGSAYLEDVDSFQFLNMFLQDWENHTGPDFYFILDLPLVSTEAPVYEQIEVVLMPNPVQKGALIRVRTDREIQDGRMLLYDNLGHLIRSDHISGGSKQFIFQAPYQTGVYYLCIQTDGQYYTRKVVVGE
ncbi:MAG: hypothetical protein EPGJADBJ_03772 [Saprospiraceae bacterium]|nr:hypothetical protein [Saprospiraceae bacterium]